MNITVYVPKAIENRLKEAAARVHLNPARFVQRLLTRELDREPTSFSEDFRALAGSWEDDRTAEEIIRDIKENRIEARRQEIR